MTYTTHYGFKKLGPGETIADEGYKFSSADRDALDAELYRQANHHHIGSTVTITGPASAPSLALNGTAGYFPPGVRYYYRYTFINSSGQESLPSPEGFIDTSAAQAPPAAPTLAASPTGGTLIGGTYLYALTAYNPDSSRETTATASAQVTASVGSANKITVTFPTLPTGAHGFNIYRSAPGGLGYLFLTSVAMNVATPPTNYVDTGAVLANCDRTLPTVNTTNQNQSIQVGIGGATPTLPAGFIWRIYRTAVSGNYSNSLVTTTGPALTFVDTGLDTAVGGPPTTSGGITNPSQVLLKDAAEVQGRLPMGLATFPFTIEFEFPGQTYGAASGSSAWFCEFPAATIVGCRATLGVGKTASGQIITDVKKAPSSATPTFSTIYTTTANRPKVESGQTRGLRTIPDTKSLVVGDALTADVISVGGATPLAEGVMVRVYGIATGYPTTSFVDGTTTGT